MHGDILTAVDKTPFEQIDLFGNYSIKLEFFQGPMDLLLYVIEKDELDIYNIPIAKITRQYLEYIELMRILDIDVAGEFMVMAARLMQIKAKMLLPSSETDEEEFDPREGLILALVEYRRIKKAAELMADMESLARLRTPLRVYHQGAEESEKVELDVNLFDLLRALKEVYSREIPEDAAHTVERIQVTVEDRMEYLKQAISEEGICFKELFYNLESWLVVVVTFIALLELARLRVLRITQNRLFGEIWIYRT